MNNKNNWHIGFYVKEMIYSSTCHVALYYDEERRSYQFCYKKGISNYKFKEGTIIVFEKLDNSLKIDEFYPLSSIRVDVGKDIQLTNFKYNDYFWYASEKQKGIQYKGEILEFSEYEQDLYDMFLKEEYLSELKNKLSSYPDPLSEQSIRKKYKEIENVVNSYNLDEILDGIEVTVEEFFTSKVGGDDSYSAYQITTTNYPKDKLDEFLIKHFQIGRIELCRSRGYTDAYNLRNPDIVAGKFDEATLERHKTSLESSYSRKEHCDYLFFKYLEKLQRDIDNSFELYNTTITKYRFLVWNITRGKFTSVQLDMIDMMARNVRNITDKSFEGINRWVADLHHKFEALQF